MTAPNPKEAFVGVLASLAAVISILERTPRAKKSVASDKMFSISLNDYRKALDEGRAALASGLVQDEAGWRPIETAPKDGTVIDVWLGDADVSDLDFYCQSRTCKRSANWYWSNGKFRPFTGWDLPLTTFVEPTHWIPLPAPPIRSARNGGAS